MSERMKPSDLTLSDEEKRRRLSRVMKDLGARAQWQKTKKRDRSPTTSEARLVQRAEKNPTLKRLMDSPPLFHEEQERGDTLIHLEPAFDYLHQQREFRELIERPTHYIEQLPFIHRGSRTKKNLPKGNKIRELGRRPYDVSRVRLFQCGEDTFVIKRAGPAKEEESLQEYRIAQEALATGIPTPKIVGHIEDKGNMYFIFEYLGNTSTLLEFSLHNEAISYGNALLEPLASEESNMSWTALSDAPDDPRWSQEKKKYNMYSDACKFLAHLRKLIFNFKYLYRITRPPAITNDQKYFLDEVRSMLKDSEQLHVDPHLLTFIRSECNLYFPPIDIPQVLKIIPQNIKILYDWQEKMYAHLSSVVGDDLSHYDENKLTQQVVELQKAQATLAKSIIKTIYDAAERAVWGVSVTVPFQRFIKLVEERADTAGIRHKDLVLRNILMKMDDKGQPIPDANGEAQFYVIDWEKQSGGNAESFKNWARKNDSSGTSEL